MLKFVRVHSPFEVSGGRVVVMADVTEMSRHFRTSSLSDLKQCLESIDPATMPDALALPSLAFTYVRSGDVLFTPMGYMSCERAMSDHSVSIRPRRGLREIDQLTGWCPLVPWLQMIVCSKIPGIYIITILIPSLSFIIVTYNPRYNLGAPPCTPQTQNSIDP